MSRQQRAFLHRGVVVGCAFVAVALLSVFYSVVSGAVDHAAVRRAALAPAGSVLVAGTAD